MPFLKSKSVCNLQWKVNEELAKRNGYRRAVFGNSHKEKFTGWFLNGMKHGKGMQTYEDGTFYEGEWVNGLRDGYGYLASKCPKTSRIKRIYTGLWANDKPSGYGIKTFPDGGVYKGEFMRGKRHGVGHMYYSDGHVYTGMWTNDARDGVGRHVNSITGSFYEGAFKKDTKCGLGRYYHFETGQMQEGVWYMDKPQISVMVDDEKRRNVAPRKTQYELPMLSILRCPNDVYLERAHETMKLVAEY